MVVWRYILLLSLPLLALWSGCQGAPRVPLLPTEHTLSGQHLSLHSGRAPLNDLWLEMLVDQLARMSRVLQLPPLDHPIDLYIFDDRLQMRRYVAQNHPEFEHRRALFVRQQDSFRIYSFWSDSLEQDLRHELTHGYLHSVVPEIPLWLDEGLAEYFEVGPHAAGLNQEHLQLLVPGLQRGWAPHLQRLEHLVSPSELTQADYAEAWLWVYGLLASPDESAELLTDYLQSLRDSGPATPPLSMVLGDDLAERHLRLVELLKQLDDE